MEINKIIRGVGTLITGRFTLTFDKIEFKYENLSWKRRLNWLLTGLSSFLKTERMISYPRMIQFEPGNICNLKCPLCHSVTDNKVKGFLKFEDFKKVMDEIGDYLLFLHFWGWGEPFMNKDFIKMIKYAKSKGIKIITSTNGHFFEDKKSVDKLIDSGLDVLIFAFDGLDPTTYEKYRKAGDFSKVVAGLNYLVERKKKKKSQFPLINLRMLVSKDNENQVEEMKKFAEKTGVEILTLKTMCSFDNYNHWNNVIPTNHEYRRFSYDNKGNPIRVKNKCIKPWNHPVIYRDGLVVPCDYFTGKEFSLGNAFKTSFSDVWFGEKFRKFRMNFKKGNHSVDNLRCDTCSMNYADVDRCASHIFKVKK